MCFVKEKPVNLVECLRSLCLVATVGCTLAVDFFCHEQTYSGTVLSTSATEGTVEKGIELELPGQLSSGPLLQVLVVCSP